MSQPTIGGRSRWNRVPDLRTQRTAAGGGIVLVLRFVVTAVLNYAFGVALAWLLPRSEFGAVGVLQNVLLLAAAVFSAGLPWALARAVAQAGNAIAATASTFRAALAGNLALGTVLAVTFAVAQLTPLRVIPDASSLLVVAVALTIVVFSLNAIIGGALRGSRRFDALGILQVSEATAKVALGLTVVGLLGLGTTGVALGFLVGALIATCCGLWGLRDRLPGPGPLAGRATLALAVPMWVGSASFALLFTLDLLALSVLGRGHGVTSAVIAAYQVAVILARVPLFVADALGEAVFPFIARGRTAAEAHGWFAAAYRWVLLGLVPLQLVLLVVPGALLALVFPSGYGDAAGLIRPLTVGTFGLLTAGMLLKALYARGFAGAAARRIPIAVATQIAALLVLIPRFGAIGAAIAFTVGGWVAAVLLASVYVGHHRPTRLPTQDVVRYVGAIAALLVVLTVANEVASPLDLTMIAAGLIAYVLIASRLELIRTAEVARARAVLGGLPAAARAVRSRLPAGHSTAARLGLLVLGSIVLATVTMQWNLSRSPDIMIDEIQYTNAALSIGQHWHFRWTDGAEFVHPPLSFLAQAGWLHLLGKGTAPLWEAVAAARMLAGVAAVLNVVLLALLVYRLVPDAGGRRRILLASVVAVLAATDPILLRFCRAALIEPFALLGCLVTMHLAVALWDRRAALYVPAIGLTTGLTLLTQEIAVFVLLTPVVFALLGRDWRRTGSSLAAVLAGVGLWLLFPLWAMRLGLADKFLTEKTIAFERLIGHVWVTGWNQPGRSAFTAALEELPQYATSYLLLAGGALALVWLVLHGRTDSTRWLLAWLLTTYAFSACTVLLGTVNGQSFVYVISAALVSTVLVADAVVAVRVKPSGVDGHHASRRLRPLAIVPALVLAMLSFAGVGWARLYVPRNDGLFRSAAFVRAQFSTCSVVNATGDDGTFAYLMPEHPHTEFPTGPDALSHGINLFLLSDKNPLQRTGNANPELTSWVRHHGTRLARFPSITYREVELWRAPTEARDPLTGVERIRDGFFVITQGSRCAGFPVIDGPAGDFATGWVAIGGKAGAGPPVTGSWTTAGTGVQVFDGVVLAKDGDRPLSAVPIVPVLSAQAPRAYQDSRLPPVTQPPGQRLPSDDEVLARLTDPAIAAAFLTMGAPGGTTLAVRHARTLLGDPIGPATPMPDGYVRQAFAGGVLERASRATDVRLAPLGRLAIEAGVVVPSADATRPAAPPRLTPDPKPPVPITIQPFLTSLGVAIAVSVAATMPAILRHRRPRRRRPETVPEVVV